MCRVSGTVSPGCPLFVDTLSWATCCRPDVRAHLQLAGNIADKPGLLDEQTAVWNRSYTADIQSSFTRRHLDGPFLFRQCRLYAGANRGDGEGSLGACINISRLLSFSTATTAPTKPPCLHNDLSRSCVITLSVNIRHQIELKTFVSYFFNSAVSMRTWWQSR